MDSWDSELKEYLRHRPLFLAVLRGKEAHLYKEYLPLKRPVLDYGCGDGFFAKVTFDKPIDIALDVEDSRIDEVKKEGVYVKMVKYDGKKIPFKDNHFATVVSNSVLEHVDGLNGALKEIYRVLRSKGKFLTTVMAAPWEDYLFGAKIFGKSYKDYMRKKQVHINLLSKNEWDESFKKAGFKVNKTVGHLDEQSSRFIDILHYFSIPSLISYKLTGKWVMFPRLADFIYPRKFFMEYTCRNVSPDASGALFYELEKK